MTENPSRDEKRDVGDELPPVLAAAARRLARAETPSPELLSDVMRAVSARPAPRRGVLRRLTMPVWRASPAQIALLAASVAFAGVALGRWSARDRADALPTTAPAAGVITMAVEVRPSDVRFVLNAPSVRTVALVGDFNGWRADAAPLTRDPETGLWIVDLRIPAGRYSYAFIVDGRWTADPQSLRAPEDDFGRPNSVLVVNRARSRT